MKEFIPKIARRPQAAHKTNDKPTEPARKKIPPGLIKIPDPIVTITVNNIELFFLKRGNCHTYNITDDQTHTAE